ncbi:MAG TPA: SRPBCC family protein [Gemmatimonadaceae bacterium]|nr:SRPBCC family protein [Gemmatimonadaceae bacterium]
MTPPPPASPAVQPRIAVPSLLLGILGGALFGARRRLPSHARAAATVGGVALVLAASHRPLAEAVRRAGTRRRSGRLSLSFVVAHPVEVVFGFCRDFENFPQFIGALREVRDHGDGRSHWCASTPSGALIEWDTVTTKYVPNRVIAWTSVPGSAVETSARLRFVPEGTDTCVSLDARYRVVEGTMSDALAALTTPPRRHEIERDVLRLGAYLDMLLARPGAVELEA